MRHCEFRLAQLTPLNMSQDLLICHLIFHICVSLCKPELFCREEVNV